MQTLWQDLRYGARMLLKSPGFTAIAVLTLALGIGANTAIFSVVNAVLIRPLPYEEPQQLVAILESEVGASGPSKLFDSYSDFEEWKRDSNSFSQLEACTWARSGQTLKWQGTAQRVLAVPVTAGFFSLLEARAAQGRTFEPEDLTNGAPVVLSYRFWKDRLGGAADSVGASLTLDGKACTVVGIMPEGFEFYPRQTDLWLLITPDSVFARDPLRSLVVVYGRLKPGINKESSQAELEELHRQVANAAPPGNWLTSVAPVVEPLQEDFTWLAGRNLRTSLLVLFAAVVCLLFIACLNVANLLLGRGAERQKELAIRAALGGGRWRLVRQLLTESLLLALLGVVPGVLLAVVGVHFFRAANPIELPPGDTVTVNLSVLGFAAGLSLLASVVFGLAPAWKVSNMDVNAVLKATGRTQTGALSLGFGRLLVIAEVALSIVLLTGAGLLIKSVVRLRSTDLGFRADPLLTARVDLPVGGYAIPEQRLNFYDRLVSNLSALPGVQSVAIASGLPLTGAGNNVLSVSGKPASPAAVGDVGVEIVSPDYFNVLEIPLLQGRPFDSRDRTESQPVAVVNGALAREYFPGEDPVGKQIRLGGPNDSAPWLTIIGVVGNVRRRTVYKEMDYVVPPAVYRPMSQSPGSSAVVMLRLSGSPVGQAPLIERAAPALDNDVAVSDVRTIDEQVSEFLSYPRFRAALLGAFAILALLLAAAGIYGVLSQAVARRTQEIGIRMALGARPRGVFMLVIGQGLRSALLGILTGLIAAMLLAHAVSSLFYDVSALDPATYLVMGVTIAGVALAACYLPARRAMKVDPMVALRYE